MPSSQLTLILPGMMPAKVDELPALAVLLKRARPQPGWDGLGAMADALGLERQQDWPLAACLAQRAGLEAGSGYWLCADPVHLEAGMSGLVLHRLDQDPMTEQESRALASSVAEELSRAWPGVRLHGAGSGQWLVSMEPPLDIHTRSPDQVFHLGVGACLPQGIDAAGLIRLMSDIQMALHDHPVNQARESAGQLTVNGVWFWGGGTVRHRRRETLTVLGEGGLPGALAEGGAEPFPAHLPDLRTPALAIAPADWGLLEAGWFRPLASRLRWGRLGRLRLGFVDACVEITPRDMWRWPRGLSGVRPPDTSGR